MKLNTLFQIVLKILGLWFLIELINPVVQIVQTILIYLHEPNNVGSIFMYLIIFTFQLLLMYLVAHFLLFKTQQTCTLLKLTENFEETEIPLNMHRSTVISISIFIIGGIVLVLAVPELINRIVNFINLSDIDKKTMGISYFLESSLRILLGLAVIMFNRTLVNLIEKKRIKE